VHLVGLVLLILGFYFHEHVVDPVHFVPQPSIFLAHIVLQINQLRSCDRLGYRVLHKVLRVNLLLHVVVVLIFVLMVHEHRWIDFMVHRWLFMEVNVLAWYYLFCEALVDFYRHVLLRAICLNSWQTFHVRCVLMCVDFLEMLIELATCPDAALIWNVVFNFIIKNLLWKLNLAIYIREFVNLWVVLIPADHHTLLGILYQMSIFSFNLKSFSANWNHHPAN